MKASGPQSEMNLVRREVRVGLPEGLHARPSTLLSQAAARYSGQVRILANGDVADAKSIFDLLGLGLGEGSVLTVEVEGANASEMLDSLCSLFDSDFADPQ